jgi:DNA-binding NarL/FixJ family response regulator
VSNSERHGPATHAGRIVVASVAVHEELRAAVNHICKRNPRIAYCSHAASFNKFVHALPRAKPHIILADGDWSADGGLHELAQLHRRLPEARALLIHDRIELALISRTLHVGVRGILRRNSTLNDLESALYAITRGELWLTRGQLAELVMLKASNEPYMDLAQLTPRENAIVRYALLARSNKQIASMLDIAEHTVAIHLHNIYSKLHLRGRFDLLVKHGSDVRSRASLGSADLVARDSAGDCDD